jgi:hypothetical protein
MFVNVAGSPSAYIHGSPGSGSGMLPMRATDPIGRLDCSAVFHHDGVLIGDFRKAWESALLIAGVGKKLVHDFRRTAVRI